jgi:hypothetical protein
LYSASIHGTDILDLLLGQFSDPFFIGGIIQHYDCKDSSNIHFYNKKLVIIVIVYVKTVYVLNNISNMYTAFSCVYPSWYRVPYSVKTRKITLHLLKEIAPIQMHHSHMSPIYIPHKIDKMFPIELYLELYDALGK